MDPVSAIEAKSRLDALLDQVEQGQEVAITRGGRTVARLVPAGGDGQPARAAVGSLRGLRADLAAHGVRFTASEFRELRDAGRR